MNKKFLSAILFGALMVTSTGTFVSCKDYDDDIDRIDKELGDMKTTIASLNDAITAGKFVKSCDEVTGGYELVFTDGSKVTIKNGTNGTNGTTVIPQFRVEGNYWQYSTDKGTTWIDVKDTEGNKVPAKGQDGESAGSNVSWVTVDGVEYIKIGDKITDLKQNNSFPNIVVDKESKTVSVTLDGQTYTLLQEGSVFKGLQTIVYRKQSQSEYDDVVKAYYLVQKNEKTNEETVMIPATGVASFKVYPGDWKPENAKFTFIDTYRTRAVEAPGVNYVAGSAKVAGNILTLRLQPINFDQANYATSLDVTMNGQYTSASDYFNVQLEKLSKDDIDYFETPGNEMGDYVAISDNQQKEAVENQYRPAHFCFEYNGKYNLNDSIDVMINKRPALSLKDLGYDYTIEYSLSDKKWDGGTVDNGIFELKDGMLTVKEKYQSSAIHEYAYIKAKCTIKSQVKGVDDMVLLQDLAIFAGRTTEVGNVELSLNESVANQSWNLNYSAEAQYLVLDVRKFEAEMGGRDLLNNFNGENHSWVMPLYADYTTGAKSVSAVDNGDAYRDATDPSKVKNVLAKISAGNIALYFKAAPNNSATSLDSLFLLIGKGTKLDAAKLWMANAWNNIVKGTRYAVNGTGVINKNIYINNLSITRTPWLDLKSATYTEMIVGKYVDNNTLWSVISDNMYDVYKYTPTDMNVKFALADKDAQNKYVKALMAGNGTTTPQIKFDAINNKIVITSVGTDEDKTVEVSKIGNILLNAYDCGTKDITYGNETTQVFEIAMANAKVIANKGARTWTVQNPYKAMTVKGDITYTDNTLAKDKTYPSYTKEMKGAGLKDAYGKDLITSSATSPFLSVSDYAKKVYGFLEAPEYSFDATASADVKADWNINPNTGVLTCIKDNVGAGYKIVIPVKVTFPSKFGRPSMVIKVTIKNAAN